MPRDASKINTRHEVISLPDTDRPQHLMLQSRHNESKPLASSSNSVCDVTAVIFLTFLVLLFDEMNCIEANKCLTVFAGKTELAKQVARYMHKDIKKVSQ